MLYLFFKMLNICISTLVSLLSLTLARRTIWNMKHDTVWNCYLIWTNIWIPIYFNTFWWYQGSGTAADRRRRMWMDTVLSPPNVDGLGIIWTDVMNAPYDAVPSWTSIHDTLLPLADIGVWSILLQSRGWTQIMICIYRLMQTSTIRMGDDLGAF